MSAQMNLLRRASLNPSFCQLDLEKEKMVSISLEIQEGDAEARRNRSGARDILSLTFRRLRFGWTYL